MAAADPGNPQSWNRYAYVMNNPVMLTDPTGLYCYFGDGQGFGWGMARNPTRECHTTDVAGTADSALNGYIDQSHAEDMTRYLTSVAWFSVTNGHLIQKVNAYFPGSTPSCPDCVGTFAHFDVDLGDAPGDGSNWWGTFAKSFFTGFSVFGSSSDSRPSCFGGFLVHAAVNFVGTPGVDTLGAFTAAHYGISSRYFSAAIPNTRVARGGVSPKQWLAADEAARVSHAAKFAFWLNVVAAEAQALGGEVSAARAGNCK